MELTLNEKQSLLANLLKLIKADGIMDPREVMYIQSIALKLEVNQAAFADVVSRVDFISTSAYSSEENKLYMFYLVCTGMNIDGHANAVEADLCKKIGSNLGLTMSQVENGVKFMTGNASNVVTETQFIAAVNA